MPALTSRAVRAPTYHHAGRPPQVDRFTNPGHGVWVKPAGAVRIEIELWGATAMSDGEIRITTHFNFGGSTAQLDVGTTRTVRMAADLDDEIPYDVGAAGRSRRVVVDLPVTRGYGNCGGK